MNHLSLKAELLNEFPTARNVEIHVYSHVTDLLHLMTKGNVCLLAMQVLKLNKADDCPIESPCMGVTEGRKDYLGATAHHILIVVWQEATSVVDECHFRLGR